MVKLLEQFFDTKSAYLHRLKMSLHLDVLSLLMI